MIVAASVGVAPGVVTLDAIGVSLRGAVFGAFVVRANRFAALVFIALVVLALDHFGVVDQSVPLGALDRVATFNFGRETGIIKDGVSKAEPDRNTTVLVTDNRRRDGSVWGCLSPCPVHHSNNPLYYNTCL